MVNAVVLINVARGQIPAVAEAVADVPGVYEVFSVGGRVDLVAIVRVKSNEEVADVVASTIAMMPGVEDTETFIAFRVYRRADVEGAFSIGFDG
ncbi:MAG: Lrp/AsnC family transcriptional regulator [Actinobacteria bacterium]|nr:Lrp/AsnC family transcriptional regulator [Actinomycetota bacterium]